VIVFKERELDIIWINRKTFGGDEGLEVFLYESEMIFLRQSFPRDWKARHQVEDA
jgi:hypothetical protein